MPAQKGQANVGMGRPPLLDAAIKGEDPSKGQKMTTSARTPRLRPSGLALYVALVIGSARGRALAPAGPAPPAARLTTQPASAG